MVKRIAACFLLLALLLSALSVPALGESDWQPAYRIFISTGVYLPFIHATDPVFTEIIAERDPAWDQFSLCDINQDGIPELLILTEYAGIEQVDVFAFDGARPVWKGTMGGNNFFQMVLSYDRSGLPGAVYALMGGPAMTLEEYRLVPAGLVKRVMGQTKVDADGMTLSALNMYEDDPQLERLVGLTLDGRTDGSEYLTWYRLEDLQGSPGWGALLGD